MCTPELQAAVLALRNTDGAKPFRDLFEASNAGEMIEFLEAVDVAYYANKRLVYSAHKATSDLIEGARWVLTRKILYPFVNAVQLYNLSPEDRANIVDAFGREGLRRLVRVCLIFDRVNALTNMQYERGSDMFGMVWTSVDPVDIRIPTGAMATINKRYSPLIEEFPEMRELVETQLPAWMTR